MNVHLESIKKILLDSILSDAEKQSLLKSVTDADKQWAITEFKLDRTEKVKKTTAILLEETIEELEQKRKAVEIQNHELEIESSLERVRTVAMGMNKTDDILSISEVLFFELRKLKFDNIRNAIIHVYKDEEGYFIDYDYSEFLKGSVNQIPYKGNPVIERFIKDIREKKDAFSEIIINGEELEGWKKFRENNNEPYDSRLEGLSALCYYIYSFGAGAIGISTFETISKEKQETLKRFRNVFDLAYKRYVDISNAEMQAREAQIQLALERVRARTMAMQHSDELADTSFLLDSQVRSLGIATRGCGFNIYGDHESTEWFSSEMGTMPAYKTPRERLFLEYYEAGNNGAEIYIKEFAGEGCTAHYEYLRSLPGIGDGLNAMIEAGGSFPTRQIDHVVFFKYGYLLFITLEPAPEAHDIFIRFAKVFEQTYTRFLDLQKAEAQAVRAENDLIEIKEARKKAEEALTELQSAQKQLIQSEKMASLGELTAGIAHEIQNPLNFVNNFSEVSKELIDEMKTELDNGNMEDAMDIANDIISNLEKINHHGKRADAIVKGMLQHSGKGDGKKEATDINQLCDEYVRLSFHGLRAKDKSFNAALRTEFDESIGSINIIPQDIGRVVMNLLTNAFYAVNLRGLEKPGGLGSYEPTILISTQKVGGKVEVKVTDNGNGIPSNIIDKIFQPFFTTKPTGQGTGLGLSLAYDIVTKGHGGELHVETEEGKGTTFTIILPTNNS